jgi:hypothetical protein
MKEVSAAAEVKVDAVAVVMPIVFSILSNFL